MKIFDALDNSLVKLDKEAYLIEASAGTGKTYSIGLLVLRLLLEQNISISRILMVTFTNQAVAELAARIRRFLILAIRVAEGNEIENEKPILELVKNYQNEESVLKLKKALSELDQASIQTIHSFCQEALTTYPLESSQAFGLELQADVLELAVSYVYEFWRENITTLAAEELDQLGKEIILENFISSVKEALSGKDYSFSGEAYTLKDYKYDYEEILKSWKDNHNSKLNEIENEEFEESYLKGKRKSNNLKKWSDFEKWIKLLMGDDDSKYKRELFEKVLKEERKEWSELQKKFRDVNHFYFWQCIEGAKKKVNEYLQEKQLLTYDEIISRMHKGVMNNDNFKKAVKEKYEAVFIDEFQDTDKLQYEIYDTLFGQGKLLFYIGDPKQSIYGWRKADLNTYFDARSKIAAGNLFKMRYNFRSTPSYVEALNRLYSPLNDPFKTGDEVDRQIRYEEVESSQKNSQGLLLDNKEIKSLQVFDAKDKTEIGRYTLSLIQEIIYGSYTIEGETGRREVKNSDIGILVRSGSEARQIKQVLADSGINAVTIDDTKVFKESTEANSLLYILEAILNTTEENINKALLNEFTGKSYLEIRNLEKDDLLDNFRLYREIWNKSGIYAAVKIYMTHFEVNQYLIKHKKLRVLTNLNQIVELLQEAEYRKELKPTGLYNYLQKQIENENSDDDAYVQRIESDEAAVKILTIHKAKGLQFPIVIAPFLDMLSAEESYFKWFSYRDPEDNSYKFYCKSLKETGQQELYEEQKAQENSRLLYVALTRAKYNCFIFRNTADYYQESILSEYKIEDLKSGCLELNVNAEEPENDQEALPEWKNAEIKEFKLADHLQGKLSFSGITAHGAYIPKENTSEIKNDYDQFIFKDMPRGTVIGNMLHLLFENIDFTGSEIHHGEELEKLLDKYYPHKKEEYRKGLLSMINHVLKADIEVNGQKIPLGDIANSSKKNEMEFDLRTQSVDLVGLNAFEAGEGIELGCITQHPAKSGLLNGFIDLFFKHEGKFYILDWKSNFLGDNQDHYASEKMTEAMNEGNYHLQYFIYAMAIKNYLEQRIQNFDYERDFGGVIYVYLRGARAGKNTGIYTNKPTLEQVEALEILFRKEQLV